VAAGLLAGCSPAPAQHAAATTSPSRTASSSVPPATPRRPTPSQTTSAAAVRTTARPAGTTPAAPPPVPPLSPQAAAAHLIDVRSIVPDALIDLRYTTPANFTGVTLYPADARCLVHQSMASGLRAAAAQLRRVGDLLVFWDCYRPHTVQVHMFQVVPNADWVARPGNYATSHEAARSVDVSVAHASTTLACPAARKLRGHCLLDMGTDFDDFTARAHAYATDGISTLAQSNRALLRQAMATDGLSVYSGEWWHFDVYGADYHWPVLDVPLD
jgi:D-alanyl-D-alanine dipeptidase